MSRRAVVTSAAPPPAGTYSQAIRSDGPLVFISGQTPRARDGQRLIGAPFEQQARAALDNLEAIARASGLSLRHAVKVDVFLRDLGENSTAVIHRSARERMRSTPAVSCDGPAESTIEE